MPKFIPLSTAENERTRIAITWTRLAAIEALHFFSGFAFSETIGNAVEASGKKLPDAVARIAYGAATPINANIGNYLFQLANNEKEANKHIFFQRMCKAGFSESDAKALYEGSWPAAQKLICQDQEIDAAGLAKKIDCSKQAAEVMLGLRHESPAMKIALIIDKSTIVGIVAAGIVGYFASPLFINNINNPFVARLLLAAIGRVTERVTNEATSKAIHKAGMWKSSRGKPAESTPGPTERTPLLSVNRPQEYGVVEPVPTATTLGSAPAGVIEPVSTAATLASAPGGTETV